MAGGCDRKTYNVIVHGLCFMLIFTAFQTSGNVQTKVLNSEKSKDFENAGYVSLAIIYTVFSLANFIAPPVVNVIGPRWAMFVGGVCYSAFIASIIYPVVWIIYAASVVVGVGAALIWTGQGNFLTLNSTEETMGRNSGIFWALLQCSLLFGNMFVYFYFKGETTIDAHSREVLYTVLLVCASIGTLAFVFCRKTVSTTEPTSQRQTLNASTTSDDEDDLSLKNVTNSSHSSTEAVPGQTPLDAFLKSFHLLRTPDMLLLSVTIAYTGFELTFFSGVYGNSIGNIDKSKLASPTRQIGLMGMLIGAGEICGGLLFGIFGKITNKHGRDPIVLIGFITHMITFYLIFLNVPDEAPTTEHATGQSWLHYSLYVYGLCAFLLGFGDASFNTQLYSILGTLYSEDSAPAFALFKFVQSVAAALGFVYTKFITLKWQLLILVIFGFAGTVTFFRVERKHASKKEQGYEPIR